MLITDQHPLNRSIMVAVLGNPNAGKSSLINNFLGFDLSAVTNRPQTTRNYYHCAVTIDRTEIVFVDTPGVHQSSVELNRRMVGQAKEGAEGADLSLALFDLSEDLAAQAEVFKSNFHKRFSRVWIVFTKTDLVECTREKLEVSFNALKTYFPEAEKFFSVSNATEEGISELTGALCDAAPNARHFYPGGEVSNKSERFFVSEYIREQAFKLLKEELPYELAVIIDEFKDFRGKEVVEAEKGNDVIISATILVNRPSQRGIVVGKQGAMIKEIGIRSRQKIEALIGGKVRLNLHVKVSPKWFKNNYVLEEIGLPRVEDSTRVWRQK